MTELGHLHRRRTGSRRDRRGAVRGLHASRPGDPAQGRVATYDRARSAVPGRRVVARDDARLAQGAGSAA
ncbi:hypothetical protein ACRAWF_01225 [Streptomyces sp. L7]